MTVIDSMFVMANITTTLVKSIDFYNLILPLLIYTLLIAIYAVFVWIFYKSLSKRDLFKINLFGGGISKAGYVLKYLIIFPIMTFLWFGILALILFFLSKVLTTESILLISIALIAAVRTTAYYREELSIDVAKILPLGLLAIFIVDPTLFSLDVVYQRFVELPSLGIQLFNYLLFVILLEWFLRTFYAVNRHFKNRKA